MRFDGREIKRSTGYVIFVRGEGKDDLHEVRIRVQALPATWVDECERMLPEPMPPIVGKQWDKNGRESPKYDDKAPAYLEARARWQYRTWAKKIHDATIEPGIVWDTDPSLKDKDAGAFYDSIWHELLGAFTRGEINRWILTVNGIDMVGGADVALHEEGLFQAVRRLLEVRGVEEDAAG